MLITTTSNLQGLEIVAYKGIVIGEAILGTNVFRDMFAGITDVVGGRSGAYEKVLRRAREQALADLQSEAAELGANAVIGVDIDYESLGPKGTLLMVTVTGTAVLARKE